MAVTSNTMDSAAGDISVEIETSVSSTMELLDIGDITYNFDINDVTQDSLNSVALVFQNASIRARDEMADGRLLSEVVLDLSRIVTLTIGSYDFPLRYIKGEFSIEDIAGVVNFEVKPSRVFELNPRQATFVTVNDGNEADSHDVTTVGEAIREALDKYGGTSQTVIVRSDHFNEFFEPTEADPSAIWGVESSAGDIANDFLQRLAKAEGSIWGVGFSTGFFVSRKWTGNKVTITQDDIIDIDRDINYPDLKTTTINFNNNGSAFSTGEFDVTDNNTTDSNARQDLSVTADMPEMIRYLFDGTDERLESDTDANSDTAALAVTDDGIDNYERALRGNAPFEISVTVEGFDTIKPWQTFDITDTTGKLDAYTGREYRPSDIAYSIDNTITITAYALS